MNPLEVLYVAGGGWLAAAVAGLLAGSWRLGLRACCVLSALGGAAAVAGGGWSLVYGNTPRGHSRRGIRDDRRRAPATAGH